MNPELSLTELIENEVNNIEGFSRFAEYGITGNISKAVRPKDRSNPSIRISEDEDGIIVNIDIIAYYGTNIPQLCYDLQTGIIRVAEEELDSQVNSVNIRVEGIDDIIEM